MLHMSHYLTEVQEAEYETMFDFYVNQLGFEYITGDYETIKAYVEQINAEHNLNIIIEGLKLGNQCIIYLNERAKEGYCEPIASYKQVL